MPPASEFPSCENGRPVPLPAETTEPLSTAAAQDVPVFVDRRKGGASRSGVERRQFANSYDELSPDARELGRAIDEYKFLHHRRFINYEELLTVIRSLGYHK